MTKQLLIMPLKQAITLFLNTSRKKDTFGFVGDDKKEYYLGFGAGTSIKRREIGFLDTLDSRMKSQDDLRFKMIALAIRDNDLEMLTFFTQEKFLYCIPLSDTALAIER